MFATRTLAPAFCLLALSSTAAAGEAPASLRGTALNAAARALGAPNGKWGPYAEDWSGLPVYASEICIRDEGAYAMQFDIWDTRSNQVSEMSPTIEAQTTTCMPVTSIKEVAEDHPVSPRISVEGYADSFVKVAIQSVRYRPGAGKAEYTCLGSTTSWYCNLDTRGSLGSNLTSADPSSDSRSDVETADEPNGKWGTSMDKWSLLPVQASQICVRDVGGYAMKFNLWDTYVNYISDWSSTISAQRTACLDISSIWDVAEGHPISPRIFVDKDFTDGVVAPGRPIADFWAINEAPAQVALQSYVQVALQSVIYNPSAGTADYTCLGSTTSMYCNLDTV